MTSAEKTLVASLYGCPPSPWWQLTVQSSTGRILLVSEMGGCSSDMETGGRCSSQPLWAFLRCCVRLSGDCIQAAFWVSPFPARCPAWRWPASESNPSSPARTPAQQYLALLTALVMSAAHLSLSRLILLCMVLLWTYRSSYYVNVLNSIHCLFFLLT